MTFTFPTVPDVLPSRTITDKDTFDQASEDFTQYMADMGEALPEFATSLNSLAAGGAMTIPYTFSTTTTDADPGAGMLRLSSATQNASTVIRVDLDGSDGSTWTNMLDTFDDSTSTVKGHILLQAVADATKWLLFTVASLASPSGYRNITVSCVAYSAASPFSNSDALVLKFQRTGDKGETGSVTGIGDHEVIVTTGNGHGSTNNKIRRYTTTQSSVGTAITYADSAANGASFTINETGLYSICMTDYRGGASTYFGASVNSAELTTSIFSITAANRLFMTGAPDSLMMVASRVVKLTAGDVVRPHTHGTPDGSSAENTVFAIRKVNIV